jgi:hypothetical protein
VLKTRPYSGRYWKEFANADDVSEITDGAGDDDRTGRTGAGVRSISPGSSSWECGVGASVVDRGGESRPGKLGIWDQLLNALCQMAEWIFSKLYFELTIRVCLQADPNCIIIRSTLSNEAFDEKGTLTVLNPGHWERGYGNKGIGYLYYHSGAWLVAYWYFCHDWKPSPTTERHLNSDKPKRGWAAFNFNGAVTEAVGLSSTKLVKQVSSELEIYGKLGSVALPNGFCSAVIRNGRFNTTNYGQRFVSNFGRATWELKHGLN